jgi:hypothetical protein
MTKKKQKKKTEGSLCHGETFAGVSQNFSCPLACTQRGIKTQTSGWFEPTKLILELVSTAVSVRNGSPS